jgi:hypothetical protein
MGYSLTVKASLVLQASMKIIGDGVSSNVFRGYFYEQGRENSDGAFTAQVMKFITGGFCKRAGSIRIEANGKITRFPTMTKSEKVLAEQDGLKEYKKFYGYF